MESLFERVRPRDDVLSGELTEAKFAASLEEVVAGTAQETYKNAGTFFAGTYPSGGLRTLLNEALGRLGGGKPDGASVIRVETNLGGGKTHNLIALYHAAEGRLPTGLAAEFMDPACCRTSRLIASGCSSVRLPARQASRPLQESPRRLCGVTWRCR